MERSIGQEPAIRTYGLETEYGARATEENYPYRGHVRALGDLATKAKLAHLPGGYLENGGRLYLDGDNIEYATSECISLQDLVASKIAGDAIASRTFAALEGKVIPHRRVDELAGSETCGVHENYGTNLQSQEINIYSAYLMGTHLATRNIFAGAGRWRDGEFQIAQKPFSINEFTASGNGTKNPLVLLRYAQHTATKLNCWELTSGDANINPEATRLKLGTTSWVIRLMEHGVDISDIALRYPIAAAKFVAGPPENMFTPLELKFGGRASAVEIQRTLAERSAALNEEIEVPTDEQQALADWLEICDSLSKGIENSADLLAQMTDWYPKMDILDRLASRGKSNEQLPAVDLFYDQIGLDMECFLEAEDGSGYEDDPSTGVGIGYKLHRENLATTGLMSVARERLTTPPLTRAQFRGRVVVAFSELVDKFSTMRMTWASFHPTNMIRCPLDPPYSPEPSFDLDEELEKAHKRPN